LRTIGLISDTHGLLRPEAKQALSGVERIIHAGDIGSREILDALSTIAPVVAVRGNNDKGDWARGIAETEVVEIEGVSIFTLHDLKELDLDPKAAGFAVVVAGHSHRPSIEEKDGVLFVNPGSAGPRRFSLPVSLGFLEIERGVFRARLKTLL
jgi:putative phosphoesterase